MPELPPAVMPVQVSITVSFSPHKQRGNWLAQVCDDGRNEVLRQFRGASYRRALAKAKAWMNEHFVTVGEG